MKIIKFKTKDFYTTLCVWWERHGFPIIPFNMLPETTLVVENKGNLVYSVCIYKTDSDLCWSAFPTSNKQVPFEDRKEGLTFLLKSADDYIKEQGYNISFTTTANKNIKDSLTKNGHTLGDEGVDHFIKFM